MTHPQDQSCEPFADLLGAFALDAVEEDEAALVRNHLRSCPRCAQEVDEHRETIALLASAGGHAPENVWGRIASTINGDTAARPATGALPALAAPKVGRPHRRRIPRYAPAWAAVLALAAALAVVVGFQLSRIDGLSHRVGQLTAEAHQSGGSPGLAAALVDPSAHHYTLVSTGGGGQPVGQLIVLPSGASWMVGSRMPALPPDQTYQLWSATVGRVVSVGLLGSHPGDVAFTVDAGVATSAYMVTVEPAGGVVAPTGAPVAQATT